jgi:hypothetical protein
MPIPPKRAKRPIQNTQYHHSLSVKCPRNGRPPLTNSPTAQRVEKLTTTIAKLVHICRGFEASLKKTMRDAQVVSDSHPAYAEYRAWERQLKDAVIQAEKALVN